MRITTKDWVRYIDRLAAVNQAAADQMQAYIQRNGFGNTEQIISLAAALADKYGEAAAAATCDMYDAVAAAQGVSVPPAEPARTPSIVETRNVIMSALKRAPATVPDETGKLVKKTSTRTMRKNAARDGAKMALVPYGDGCPFCKMLGSRGWENARSSKSFEAHLHKNCRCEYIVRFNSDLEVEGYNPDALYDEFMEYDGNWKEKMNAMRSAQNSKTEDTVTTSNQKAGSYGIIKQTIKQLEEEAEKWVETLTPDEKRAIEKYAYNPGDSMPNRLFERINSMLRGEIQPDEMLERYVSEISSGIKKFKINSDFLVYRRVSHNPTVNIEKGDVFKGEQFFSASVDPKKALKKEYLLKIHVKEGTAAAYIDILSKFDQTELLIDKDVIYRVISIKGKEIELEVIL